MPIHLFLVRKLEVQLFGGTIERAKRSLGVPFDEDSIVNKMII